MLASLRQLTPRNRSLRSRFRRDPGLRGPRMSLTLTVDGERWRSHLLRTVTELPGIVPVAKGNGYGFGIGRLARRCTWLDEQAATTGSRIDMMAVGTYLELQQAAP